MNYSFKVIIWNINRNEVNYYDVIPYLTSCVKDSSERLITFSDYKQFILQEAKYEFWSRCQYEVVVTGFPVNNKSQKIDVFDQIEQNIDVVTKCVMHESNARILKCPELDDIITGLYEKINNRPSYIRYGQAVYNDFYNYFEKYNLEALQNKDIDCYYDDSKVTKFITTLVNEYITNKTLWDTN